MSKLYINPLGLGKTLIETEVSDDCELCNDPPFAVWKLPRSKEWAENISKALKGKKAGAGQKAATEAAKIYNTGKKRPKHAKLMRKRYEDGHTLFGNRKIDA